MKELDLWVFVAVFQEMLGPLLWLLAALAVAALAGFVAVVARERGLSSRRLVRAELAGIAGGLVALAVMWAVTHSSPLDVGGPIDWVVIAVIWTLGALGAAVAAYAALGLAAREPARPTAQ